MSSQRPNKQPNLGNDGLWLWLAVLGVLIVVVGGWMLAYLAASLSGLGEGGPGIWLLDPGPKGRWSGKATVLLVAFVVPLLAFTWWLVKAIRTSLSGREWTDSLAASMSSRRDFAELLPEAVAADTERLGSQDAGIGVSLCKAVLNHQWLYSTYEWCQVWIMGPRAGKTRSVAVPQLVEHGGAAVATSNKSDIVYLTRGPRSELGKVWIFDPQDIYREGVRFWWNPLTYVTNLERAEKLAAIWLNSRSASEAAAEDAFFGPESRKLLRNMIMAAALAGAQVTMISRWLNFPDGAPGLANPADILREHGFTVAADQVESAREKVAETRDGIYGGAASGVGWMANPDFVRWVTEPEEGGIEFSTRDFVRSTQTIYLLSKDGEGSARALIGALTIALWEAGRELAEESGGRVPTPVLFMLDECANIVRWGELPALFSYSGSLGLILVVILQSRAQGFKCWGKDGFTEMWSAANISFVGRGINDDEHLSALAQLVGDRQRRDNSISVGRGQRSTSTQIKDERILTEADLRALPRGRGVLFVSGTRSILAELVDLSKRRDAARIEESIAAFKEPWMEVGDELTSNSRATDDEPCEVVAGEVVS